MKKKLIGIVCVLIVSVMALCACGGSGGASVGSGGSAGSGAAPAPAGGTVKISDDALKVGSSDSFASGHFDLTGGFSLDYNAASEDLIYDFMLWVDPKTGEYDTDILEDYHFDSDKKELVLTLKDGIYFSDGDQMLAEDLLYTFQREALCFINSEMLQIMLLDEATVSDDGLTLTVPFNTDYGPWRKFLLNNSGVHNKSWEEGKGDDMNFDDPAMICGSGPYKVVDYVVDAYTVFEKRDDWWMEGQQDPGTCAYDQIVVTKYSDSTTMMIDYELGVIDMAIGISASDYDRVLEDPSLGEAFTMNTNYIAMLNMDVDNTEALSNKALREALAYAINKESVSKLAFGSLQRAAVSSIPESNPACITGLSYPYDPDKAKQIVEENNLEGTTLTWIIDSGPNAKAAEAIQSMADQVGIKIDLEVKDIASARVDWSQPGATAFILEGTTNSNNANDPYVEYQAMQATSFAPASGKQDPKLNELFIAAKSTSNEEERVKLYQEVQQYLYDNVYVVPLCEWYTAGCFHTDKIASQNIMEVSFAMLRSVVPAK